jgi:HEAT repeat protein
VSAITTEDRERIFDVLKLNTLAQEDVVRDAAVLALGKVGTPDAVAHLRERYKNETKSDIREDILLALGIARTTGAIEQLTEVVKTGRGRQLSFALLGLGLTQNPEASGPVVLEWFNANLKNGRRMEDQLASATVALGNLRYAEAEKALASALSAKSTPDVVKVHAALALGEIGTENARKILESHMDGPQEVARASILALGHFADPEVAKRLGGKEGLGQSDPLASAYASVSLARVLDRLPEDEWKGFPKELRQTAMKPEKSAVRAQYANLALSMIEGGIDQDMRKYYREALGDAKINADTGMAIAVSAGIADSAGMDAVLETIVKDASADPKLRGYAAIGLGMTGDPKRTPTTLREIYTKSDNQDTRRGCVLGIGLAGDRKDVPFLLQVITGTDKAKPLAGYTRGAAVLALGMIKDGDSVARIQQLLGNSDPYVRAYAIAALGYLADKDEVPVLPSLFEHANFRAEFPSLILAMRNL